jgi:hypothetical protein
VNLSANVSGGSPTFEYSWSGNFISPTSSQTATVNPQNTGSYNYSVFVTDAYNCTASATATINVNPNPLANAGSANYTICNGDSVVLGGKPTASGGTAPYSYNWTGGAAGTANPAVRPSTNFN